MKYIIAGATVSATIALAEALAAFAKPPIWDYLWATYEDASGECWRAIALTDEKVKQWPGRTQGLMYLLAMGAQLAVIPVALKESRR